MKGPCSEIVEACRLRYLAVGGRVETWAGDYAKVFKWLPQDKPLTAARLNTLLERWEPNTRSRHRASHALLYLARFAGLKWHPGELAGRYKALPVDASKIPSDAEIQHQFFTLRNPGWRWFYGVLAAYGLRPHEVLRLDIKQFRETDGRIYIPQNTKTGVRTVFPLYPEWFDLFEIRDVARPSVSLTRTNSQLGHSATEYFSDTVHLPFNLYSVRHAWARRAYLSGYSDKVAAMMMGHSRAVHETIYYSWFSEMELERAFKHLVADPDRPQPPKL